VIGIFRVTIIIHNCLDALFISSINRSVYTASSAPNKPNRNGLVTKFITSFSRVQIQIAFKYGFKVSVSVSSVCYLTRLSESRLYGIQQWYSTFFVRETPVVISL
jgi:hypothetical protein